MVIWYLFTQVYHIPVELMCCLLNDDAEHSSWTILLWSELLQIPPAQDPVKGTQLMLFSSGLDKSITEQVEIIPAASAKCCISWPAVVAHCASWPMLQRHTHLSITVSGHRVCSDPSCMTSDPSRVMYCSLHHHSQHCNVTEGPSGWQRHSFHCQIFLY